MARPLGRCAAVRRSLRQPLRSLHLNNKQRRKLAKQSVGLNCNHTPDYRPIELTLAMAVLRELDVVPLAAHGLDLKPFVLFFLSRHYGAFWAHFWSHFNFYFYANYISCSCLGVLLDLCRLWHARGQEFDSPMLHQASSETCFSKRSLSRRIEE
jgi:hypothetical protein